MPITPMPNETARLRRVLDNPNLKWRFTFHALEEMAADDIITADIEKVLRGGVVSWVEQKRDLLWHVEGADVDGRTLRVVIAVEEAMLSVKVITAMVR
jgi:hypothetical protein